MLENVFGKKRKEKKKFNRRNLTRITNKNDKNQPTIIPKY